MRSVLITGGTGSIGRVLVSVFAKADYSVTFQYSTNATAAATIAAASGSRPVRIDFKTASASDLPAEEFDVIINNAAINVSSVHSHEVSERVWSDTLLVNVTAPFLVVRRYLPAMIAARWGRIINISSIYGLRGCEQNLPYTVSKHALSGLTKTVSKEYAALGITCNEICPGPVESELMQRIAEREVSGATQSAESYLESVRQELPAKRMATAEDVANLALFLASEDAAYINGVSVPLDGGWIA